MLKIVRKPATDGNLISATIKQKSKQLFKLLNADPSSNPVPVSRVKEACELAKFSMLITLFKDHKGDAESLRAVRNGFDELKMLNGHGTFGKTAMNGWSYENNKSMAPTELCVPLALANDLVTCTQAWTKRSFYEECWKLLPNGRGLLEASTELLKEVSAKAGLPVSRDKGERGKMPTFAEVEKYVKDAGLPSHKEYTEAHKYSGYDELGLLGLGRQFNRTDNGGASGHDKIQQVAIKRITNPNLEELEDDEALAIDVSKRFAVAGFSDDQKLLIADIAILSARNQRRGTAKRQSGPFDELERRLRSKVK